MTRQKWCIVQQDAREKAKRNHITNAEFFVGKAEEVLPEFYEKMSGEAQAGSVAAEPGKKGQASDMLHEVKHLRKRGYFCMNKEDTIKVINNDEIKEGHLPEQSESRDDENQVLENFFIKQRNVERKRKVCKIIIIVSILIVLLVMLILHINKENEKREKLERWYYSFWLNGFEYTYWLRNYSIESVREKMELHKAEIEEASEPWFRGGIGELLLNPYYNPEVEKWSEEEYDKHRKEINAALWKDVAGKFLPIFDYPETQKEQKIRVEKTQEAQAAIELLILGDEVTQTEYNSLLDIPPDVFYTAIILIEHYGVISQDDAFLAKIKELEKIGVDIHKRRVETFWIGYVH